MFSHYMAGQAWTFSVSLGLLIFETFAVLNPSPRAVFTGSLQTGCDNHGDRTDMMCLSPSPAHTSGMKYEDGDAGNSMRPAEEIHHKTIHEGGENLTSSLLEEPSVPQGTSKPAQTPSGKEDQKSPHTDRQAKRQKHVTDEATAQAWKKEISTNMRPSEGGDPDIVEFGMQVQRLSFYGGIATRGFTVDLVLTLMWNDTRQIPYVEEALMNAPAHHDHVTLDRADAKKLLWEPEVELVNRDFEKLETQAWSLKVDLSGRMTEVHQFAAKIRTSFDMKAFPFDRQTLTLDLVSVISSSDEVKLRPSKIAQLMSISSDLFDKTNFVMESSEVSVNPEKHGFQDRSRGRLALNIRREWWKFCQDELSSAVLIALISWLILWFPPLPAFTMPRAGGTSVTLLTMINIHIRTINNIPLSATGGLSWIEVVVECCLHVTILSLCCNLLSEIARYRWKQEEFSAMVLDEAKVVCMGIFLFAMFICTLAACLYFFNITSLFTLHIIWLACCLRLIIYGSLIIFGASVYRRADSPAASSSSK
mmetsp:Transcript_160439/g.307992  ORF Transcript_160439/g.307992 Transcript_160439/m.307992 type:complete len:533 (-) Transcript_160439:77-1675(-)